MRALVGHLGVGHGEPHKKTTSLRKERDGGPFHGQCVLSFRVHRYPVRETVRFIRFNPRSINQPCDFKMRILITLAIALIPVIAGREIARQSSPYREISSCPEPYGLQTYPHPRNCDQFYKCENGTLTLETCENGLLYDGYGAVHNHCNYYWGVNCGDRVAEVTPDPARYPNSVCEYAFGLFKVSSGCEIYYYRCAYGEAEEVPCEKGLAYDERTHSCNWPDLMIEEYGCDPEKVVGFRCPDVSTLPANSLTRQFLPFPRYPVPNDCARLVTCVNDYPRLLNCGYGSVFNENTLTCDDPENVPSCANYYK